MGNRKKKMDKGRKGRLPYKKTREETGESGGKRAKRYMLKGPLCVLELGRFPFPLVKVALQVEGRPKEGGRGMHSETEEG